MTRGFAFLTYPAAYRSSGVMTFVVGSDGTVRQKDLGPDTARLASEMTLYDPDQSWQLTAPDAVPPEEADPAETQAAALPQANAQ